MADPRLMTGNETLLRSFGRSSAPRTGGAGLVAGPLDRDMIRPREPASQPADDRLAESDQRVAGGLMPDAVDEKHAQVILVRHAGDALESVTAPGWWRSGSISYCPPAFGKTFSPA